MHDNNPVFSPIITKRVSEVIYDQICQRIIDGELKVGDKLPPERTLMELYQRSRPTIREALRMLEQEGVIKTIAGNKGSYILGFTTQNLEDNLVKLIEAKNISMEDLVQYRALNDSGYIAWAAENRSEEDLQKLSGILDDAEKAIGDYEKFFHCDREFHRVLAKASNNQLACIVNSILEQVTFMKLDDALLNRIDEHHDLYLRIMEHHRRIFEAVRDQDPELARTRALTVLGDFIEITKLGD